MGRRAISSEKLTETLTLSLCHDGFWLYDKVLGMNAGMRGKTEKDAFVEALMYYQGRLKEVEQAYTELARKVDVFVSQFIEEDLDEHRY